MYRDVHFLPCLRFIFARLLASAPPICELAKYHHYAVRCFRTGTDAAGSMQKRDFWRLIGAGVVLLQCFRDPRIRRIFINTISKDRACIKECTSLYIP